MRKAWEQRARQNFKFYVATWLGHSSDEQFLKSGQDDYEQLVRPKLSKVGKLNLGGTVLDLGCGPGRMSRPFASDFKWVIAADISQEMLRQGKVLNRDVNNISWVLFEGRDLSALRRGSIDVVFSYLMLQHLPAKDLALFLVREMVRVLKPHGTILIQFNSSTQETMNLKGRMFWGILDRLIDRLPPAFVRSFSMSRLAGRLGLDLFQGGSTWHGAVLDASEVIAELKDAGVSVIDVEGRDTPLTWCVGVKSSSLSNPPWVVRA